MLQRMAAYKNHKETQREHQAKPNDQNKYGEDASLNDPVNNHRTASWNFT